MKIYKDFTPIELLIKIKNLTFGLYYSIRFDAFKRIQVVGRIKIIKRYGYLKVGRCLFWPGVVINIKGRDKINKGVLTIGDRCTIGDRTEIHVSEKVSIGNNVIIGWDCVILDHAYHKIKGEDEKVKPVIIEDDVWIACRAIILPGVRISSNSIVAAGSVVTKDVPPGSLVAGNPAKVVRAINGWES